MKGEIMRTFKIRTYMVTIVTTLILITVSILLSLQYFSSKQLATLAINTSIKHISEKIELRIIAIDKQGDDFLSMLEVTDNVQANPVINGHHKSLIYLTTIMKKNDRMYAIFIGYGNGDFYEVINLNSSSKVKAQFKVKQNEVWLVKKIIDINGEKVLIDEFLDKNLKTLRAVPSPSNYNPTQRPWYKKALTSNNTVETKPYLFYYLQSYGITYAKKIKDSQNVMGIDMSLQNISNFLKQQTVYKGSQIYLLQDNKTVIASNMDEDQQPKDIKKILNHYNEKSEQVISLDGIEYFIYLNSINSKRYTNSNILSLIPKDEAMAPYNERIIRSIVVGFLIILLFSPLILRVTKFIVDPIKDLEKENEKIKQRKFDEVVHVDTQIKELSEFSTSFVTMARSIKEYEKAQEKLMDSFIQLIAGAIDAKSEYTGGHCNKVPIITLMLAKEASKSEDGIFKEFQLKTEDEIRELNIAAWLHDCGKVTTPEYVVDKATKLETIYNRIHEIRTRFEVIHRDLTIESLEKLANGEEKKHVEVWLKEEQEKLKDDFAFIAQANIGGEFMSAEDIQRVEIIAQREWKREFDNSIGLSQDEERRYVQPDSNIEHILADKKSHIIERTSSSKERYKGLNFKTETPKYLYNLGEVYNLSIAKGTLTEEERFKIQEHIMMSIKMLEQLPFPDYLKRVPQYAGAHHETLIGTGYPKGLTANEMPLPAKIMAIADVFEALTASDRPYKKGKSLSVAIKILSFMVKDKHLDADLFKLLLTSGIYMKFAKEYLKPEQIDKVDINQYL